MLGDFMRDQIQPMQGEIQLNIGKLKKLFKISKFQFSVFFWVFPLFGSIAPCVGQI